MPYTVEHDPVENIVIAKIWGKANLPRLEEFAEEVVLAIRRANCFRVLTDLRSLELDVPLIGLYSLPGTLGNIASARHVDIFAVRRALVIPDGEGKWNFYETISYNRGHVMKAFHDLQEAKDWLKED